MKHPKPRAMQIALVGFPILEQRTNPVTHALATLVMQEKHWEIALAARQGSGGIKLAEKMRCNGILARLLDPQMARAARATRIPLVNVSGWLTPTEVSTVKTDNKAIGRLAADHLIGKNFKHLALVVAPGGVLNLERESGFLERAAAANLPVECFRCTKNTPAGEGMDWPGLARWLSDRHKPTGLFLTDDPLALRVLEILRESGLSVPYDVGIVCGPLHPERGALCSPSLTFIDPDTAGVYRHAVERLEAMMLAPNTCEARTILIPPAGIREGDSTRLTASDDPLVTQAIRIMDAKALQGLNVNQLCAELGVACSTLERHFKRALGVLPHEYVTDLRIACAKGLLAGGDKSLEEIATASGFSNRKRLNLVFRSAEGVTPGKWRDKCRTTPLDMGQGDG